MIQGIRRLEALQRKEGMFFFLREAILPTYHRCRSSNTRELREYDRKCGCLPASVVVFKKTSKQKVATGYRLRTGQGSKDLYVAQIFVPNTRRRQETPDNLSEHEQTTKPLIVVSIG